MTEIDISLSGYNSIIGTSSESSITSIVLDPPQAEQMYIYLHDIFFKGILNTLWNEALDSGRFADQYGNVDIKADTQTTAGIFTVGLTSNADGKPFHPFGGWRVSNIDREHQPEGLLYNLSLYYPSGYRDENIGITKDNQIIVTGSFKTLFIDNPSQLNAETSRGHYTPVSILHTIAQYNLLKPLREVITGALN